MLFLVLLLFVQLLTMQSVTDSAFFVFRVCRILPYNQYQSFLQGLVDASACANCQTVFFNPQLCRTLTDAEIATIPALTLVLDGVTLVVPGRVLLRPCLSGSDGFSSGVANGALFDLFLLFCFLRHSVLRSAVAVLSYAFGFSVLFSLYFCFCQFHVVPLHRFVLDEQADQ